PQLVTYRLVDGGDGVNVGFNPVGTAAPGGTTTYQWYAGDISISSTGTHTATPIEFGATNLISSDPIKHSNKGAIGALIIEPKGATWTEDANSRASATVTPAGVTPPGAYPSFREFVLIFQDDLNLRFGDGSPVPLTAEAEDPEDSGHKAFNYRTEPLWKRMGYAPDTLLGTTRTYNFASVLSNAQVGGDPVTPVFTARVGDLLRFRVLEPGGHSRNHVFQVHGHFWQEAPYTNGSTVIGDNNLSELKGAQSGHGPSNHLDVVIDDFYGAGGTFGVTGDYLFRDQSSFLFDGGLWGILRVTP
ncbi:MAG: copper oxidase, partial [Acidobacteria bacterium]|nr:copper oxidase [Acidobacteriota bacterium]